MLLFIKNGFNLLNRSSVHIRSHLPTPIIILNNTMTRVRLMFFVAAAALLIAACPPKKLPAGAKWLANPNCTLGPVFLTSTPPPQRCRCWGHCGYICQAFNRPNGGGSTRNPSPCANGGVYFNEKGERCRCQSFNHTPYYVCTRTTPTPSTA